MTRQEKRAKKLARKLAKKERRNRRRKDKQKTWFRSGKFNYHHIQNKCNGGTSDKSNLLLFDVERHNAWHFLFGNLNFDEVIELLKRVKSMKHLTTSKNEQYTNVA